MSTGKVTVYADERNLSGVFVAFHTGKFYADNAFLCVDK